MNSNIYKQEEETFNNRIKMDLMDHTDNDIDNEEFYFESDHLALRGNPDYSAVLRTIATLQAQRTQAAKDIDALADAEAKALEDPEEFVKKLISGKGIDLPGPITIAELPKVNFDKYNVTFPEYPEDRPTNTNSQDVTVRGRIFDQTKPETFNQLWTSEEQRRLEQLLVEYPPEAVEMQRFAKIARALGNRTTKQVASRIQKFFKKLHSAGMPIPGRIPKSTRYSTLKTKMSRRLQYASTFFPAHDVPVVMPEDDDTAFRTTFDPLNHAGSTSAANSVKSFGKDRSNEGVIVDEDSESDESSSSDLNKAELRKIKLLERVRKHKENKDMVRNVSEHEGFECNLCSEDPIIGIRWHCATCSDDSIDFCTDCFVSQLMSEKPHPVFHKFNGLRIAYDTDGPQTFSAHFDADSDDDDQDDSRSNADINVYDKDYFPAKFSKDDTYNYLDPNFLPE